VEGGGGGSVPRAMQEVISGATGVMKEIRLVDRSERVRLHRPKDEPPTHNSPT